MDETGLVEQLAYLVERRGQDEASVLADAVHEGIHALYADAVVEAYPFGLIPRDKALATLGSDQLAAIEYQRDALRRDITWGGQDTLTGVDDAEEAPRWNIDESDEWTEEDMADFINASFAYAVQALGDDDNYDEQSERAQRTKE